uniref:Uncharacterized protein n=1 Tax=Leersia perrieri TaxID=77586 RepID=A0A0D9V977_9ORYZ
MTTRIRKNQSRQLKNNRTCDQSCVCSLKMKRYLKHILAPAAPADCLQTRSWFWVIASYRPCLCALDLSAFLAGDSRNHLRSFT